MPRSILWFLTEAVRVAFVVTASQTVAAETPILPPISERFASATPQEVPSFQRHVVNMFSRLGCNGRACHGSFQGQGGFRLSLFGYDFKADHDALFDKSHPRVNLEQPDESPIIAKPTDANLHEGGERYRKNSWQYRVLRRWIEGGAKYEEQPQRLVRLEVTPADIWFREQGERVTVKAVAVWEDRTREDVTPLCRFQTNNEQVATIDERGLVTAGVPGDTQVVVFYDNGVVPIPVIRPVSDKIGDRYPSVPTPSRIDELVVAKLRKLGIVPSELCSDAEFLRRVSLDLAGTLPTPQEVEQFLADKSPHKRKQKIDELLETPAYAAWWSTKLCDFTGNNDEQLNNNVTPLRGGASQEWYDWVYKRVAANKPYDQLVSGMVTAVSRQPNEDYTHYCQKMSALYREGTKESYADLPGLTYYWGRRDFRDPDARAVAFAYSFLGIRLQCAQCHKHPFDQWSKEDFHLFKNFFSRVTAAERANDPETQTQFNKLVEDLGGAGKLRNGELRKELPNLLKQGKTVPFPEVYVSKAAPVRPKNANPNSPSPSGVGRLLGGEKVELAKYADPRTVVMDWLRDRRNPYFARAFVNRVWASYFNVGIVNPPDDNSLANPPSNPPLLEYLAHGFIQSGFDMQWVHRQILNSRTYQLSWQPNDTNRRDETNFSHAVPRRLPAEVIYDALRQAASSDTKARRLHAELPERAIALAGSAARSNRLGGAAYVLTAFGRSSRRSNCDCDRSSEASLLQTVFLQNDQQLLQLLDSRQDGWLAQVSPQLRSKLPEGQGDEKAKQLRNLRNDIDAVTAKLKNQKQAGNQEAVQRMTSRLKNLQQQLARLQPAEVAPATKPDANPAELCELVRQAYLRTMSRYPTESELSGSQQYLASSPDRGKGLRDLLWALVNTKEFIVNH